jgi:predicted DNA-binding antitoxin AbrB/MazE fold protein
MPWFSQGGLYSEVDTRISSNTAYHCGATKIAARPFVESTMTVRAIYENGVFKPAGPVDLPDKAEVELEARLVQPQSHHVTEQARQGVLEVLSRRYRTGQTDAAARHDEHQP